jgi:hypothetical protein
MLTREQNDAIFGPSIRVFRITGYVREQNGNPVAGAKINVAGISATSDSSGHFDVMIPGDRLQPEFELGVTALGYVTTHLQVVANANDVIVSLTRVTEKSVSGETPPPTTPQSTSTSRATGSSGALRVGPADANGQPASEEQPAPQQLPTPQQQQQQQQQRQQQQQQQQQQQ